MSNKRIATKRNGERRVIEGVDPAADYAHVYPDGYNGGRGAVVLVCVHPEWDGSYGEVRLSREKAIALLHDLANAIGETVPR